MYLERPEAEDRGAPSGQHQPQWETIAIEETAARGQRDSPAEEEEEEVPDAQMLDFLQPARVRPVERIIMNHASCIMHRPTRIEVGRFLRSTTVCVFTGRPSIWFRSEQAGGNCAVGHVVSEHADNYTKYVKLPLYKYVQWRQQLVLGRPVLAALKITA